MNTTLTMQLSAEQNEKLREQAHRESLDKGQTITAQAIIRRLIDAYLAKKGSAK